MNSEAQGRALLEAAHSGNINGIDDAIALGADVNATNQWGTTALHYAACYGHIEITKRLINAGAKVNVMNIDGATPLGLSRDGGHTVIEKMLLKKGATTRLTPSRTGDSVAATSEGHSR